MLRVGKEDLIARYVLEWIPLHTPGMAAHVGAK